MAILGADGVRGRVGVSPMTPEDMFALGRAIGHTIASNRLIVIGCDTRASSPLFVKALSEGFMMAGVDVCDIGVVPTPAVSLYAQKKNASCGVMITGSHNPEDVNGLKVFNAFGHKVDGAWWNKVQNVHKEPLSASERTGKSCKDPEGITHYMHSLETPDYQGRVIVDCANGSNTACLFPAYCERIGVGGVINVNCGTQHSNIIQKAVIDHKADVGFSFDGDGDRVWACDAQGILYDGNALMALLAFHDPCVQSVVVTQYANSGLVCFYKQIGKKVFVSEVGDAHVARTMRSEQADLGGEPSGHILLKGAHVGDGAAVMMRVLRLMHEQRSSLADLAALWQPWHEVLFSVAQDCATQDRIETIKSMSLHSRCEMRFSQTEPVMRVYMECKEQNIVLEESKKVRSVFKTQ